MKTPECTRTVRDILLRDWDPLGIGDNLSLADEYDAYLPDLMRLLARDPSIEQLSLHLEGIESALGGMSASERRLRAAWRLVETFRREKARSPGGA
jgi:hypothetical protein